MFNFISACQIKDLSVRFAYATLTTAALLNLRYATCYEVADSVIKALGTGHIEYRDFPEVLKGKYQNYTQSDTTKLLEAGYDQGFYDMYEAVKEYCDFLDEGGYFKYGK